VQAELQALQGTVAELSPVEGRPAQDGDVAVVDLLAEDGSAQRDYVVEVGSGRLVEEIENALRGLEVGASREVAYELADGSRRTATVVLKELHEKVLPPLDDELVKRASEFDTLDALQTDVEGRLREQIEDELEGIFRAAAADALVKATNFTPRGPLVEARTRELLTGLARQLEARGVDAESYMRLTQQTPELLEQRLRARRRSRSPASWCSRRSPTSSASTSPTTRSARSSATPARTTRTSRSSSRRAAPTASATTSA
jgi:FKBP-type peptidyl-prolyl cis-trans isomerase (trigger factor)